MFDLFKKMQVKKTFPRCEIVGKRFPICHVHVNDATVEVCLPSLLVEITSYRHGMLEIGH